MDSVAKYIPINFAIIGSPVNWVTVTLMVWLAGLMLAFIAQHLHPNVSTSN